tara:strand:- start:79 stop:648 length:570 start_codon:yes stop_codon:yes gene_type:complete
VSFAQRHIISLKYVKIDVVFLLVAAILCLGLTGCSGGVDTELRSYVQQVLQRKAKPFSRPPPPEPYVVYTYQGSGADPFIPFFEEPEHGKLDDDSASEFAPIEGRVKEELESFPLDGLRMVGTLQQEEEVWGVILNQEGTIYRVKMGNYLGQNFGKITGIWEDRIELEERARDGRGKWHLRDASIALAE